MTTEQIAKVAAGWKYGEVKDSEKKVHPCFVALCAMVIKKL